jgi:SAM-dependent methyltransferase
MLIMKENDYFLACYALIKRPKIPSGIGHDRGSQHRITNQLLSIGITTIDYEIDVDEYKHYFNTAEYKERYPKYYDFNLHEKSLEHYLCSKLLRLQSDDVYIDVASEHSPVPEIYSRLFGAKCYRQDLSYQAGVHGDRIGGDAGNMPVTSGFASKMGLHCSLEHFEGQADIAFIKEAARVLRPGGRVCIVPLYLSEFYAIQTDPVVAIRDNVPFDEDAVICCAKGWGNRHGRFYDYLHLKSRIVSNLGEMTGTVYAFTNAKAVDPSCYVLFGMVIDKPAK